MIGKLVLAAVLAVSCGSAFAAEMRLGGITFDAPKGWKVEEVTDGLTLTRSFPETEDTEQAAAMMQLLPVSAGPSSMNANFDEVVSWIDGMAEEDPMISSQGTSAGGHAMRVEYRCCSYDQDVSLGQTIVGLASENEQLIAGLIFFNTSSDHEDAAEQAFQTLVRSVRFSGDGDNALAPQPGDGGLEGVFTHLDFGLMPNVFGGLDFNSESEIVVFDKSGLFSNALPSGTGLAAHCARTPVDCGTYKVSGGGFWTGGPKQIEMRSVVNDYGVIETETLTLEETGQDLKIDDGDYFRLPPFASGTTFDGTWNYTWASSGMTATSSGSVAVERTLVLSPDGRFSRDGWSGGSSSGEMGGVTVSGDRVASSGTYRVDGYEMVLTGDDGGSETVSIFAPDKGSDELLVIDGSNYLKQE